MLGWGRPFFWTLPVSLIGEARNSAQPKWRPGQVIPLARTQALATPSSSQNALGLASSPFSSAETEKDVNNSGKGPMEEGEVKDEELDE